MSNYHTPILLAEVTDALHIDPAGVYVDCTFGGGGHSKELLKHLNSEGKLFLFDQDEAVRNNLPEDERVTFIPHNFRHLQRFLKLHKVVQVDGIMADLGVSSHQLDEASRGFSTRFEADLDMRMNSRQLLKAYDVVVTYPEESLHKLFEQYGEVTNAKTLAKTIVAARNTGSLKTINNFKVALGPIVKGNPNKYFAQVFQALRIEVNDELGALKDMLLQTTAVMKPGGRIAILTFHSLEDRIIKNFFKKGNFDEDSSNPFEQHEEKQPPFRIITKKPIIPSEEEQKMNSRSRSAKLRVAERSSVR